MRKCLILVFLIYTFQNLHAQEYPIEKLSDFIKYRPQEKIYLHTNKEIYAAGETIWFKPYRWNAYTHSTGALSQVLYVDLGDSQFRTVATVVVNLDSHEGGSLTLPDTIGNGSYTLKAYTSYQLNFDQSLLYTKTIKVINEQLPSKTVKEPDLNFDLQFFAESGYLIAGQVNTVGFKAVNQNGLGTFVKGSIIDKKGEIVNTFASEFAGMGSFKLIPEEDNVYTASLSFRGLTFDLPLPRVKSQGPLMTIQPTLKDITIRVLATNYPLTDHYVLGYQHGTIFLNSRQQNEDNFIYAKFNSSQLEPGLAYFTLFNAQDEPLSERMCYIHGKNQPTITFEAAEPKRTKSNVTVEIKTLNPEHELDNLSTSVYDADLYNKYSGNIVTFLRLSSEIKGHIETPRYYFDEIDSKKYALLDNLMLTQAWRRYEWNKVLADTLEPIRHFLEPSLTIRGQLFNYYDRDKATKGEVSLTVMENPLINTNVTTTNDGQFQFGNLDFPDSVTLIFQAKKVGRKPKKNPLKERNDAFFIHIKGRPKATPSYTTSLLNDSSWISRSNAARKLERKYLEIERAFEQDMIILDAFELEVKQDQYAEGVGNDALIFNRPTHRYELDSIKLDPRLGANSVRDILIGLQIPGFNAQALTSRGATSISGSNKVGFFYNGVEVDEDFVLQDLSPSDVGTVDYFTGSSAAIFGVRGASGIIAIYSRSNESSLNAIELVGITNLAYSGFSPVKEFYKPNIEADVAKPNFRRALHWNPSLMPSKSGEAKIEFTTSDAKGDFIIEVQGVLKDGSPIFGLSEFTVEN